jgi:hypothetical protein
MQMRGHQLGGSAPAFNRTISEHNSIESFGDKKRYPCSLLSANSEDLASRNGQKHSIFEELKCYRISFFVKGIYRRETSESIHIPARWTVWSRELNRYDHGEAS